MLEERVETRAFRQKLEQGILPGRYTWLGTLPASSSNGPVQVWVRDDLRARF